MSDSAPTAAATPRPWNRSKRSSLRIFAGSDDTIATVGCQTSLQDQWESNAALIVEAVNSFDSLRAENAALRAALRPLLAAFEGLRPFPLVVNAIAKGLIEDARTALKDQSNG